MSADDKNLQAFILACTKATLSSQHAISLLRAQVDALESRVNTIAPIAEPENMAKMIAVRKEMDAVFSLLEDRAEALISSLEAYVNG